MKYTNTGEAFEPQYFSLSTNCLEEKWRKELAINTWAQIFEGLGMRYNLKPKAYYTSKEFASERSYKYVENELPNAEFYLHGAKAFGFVKWHSYDEERNSEDSSAKWLAQKSDCSVTTLYSCGRFRLTDYRTAEPEDGEEESSLRSDAVLSRCLNNDCGLFYFHTASDEFQGCRFCASLETTVICYGKDGFLRFEPTKSLETSVAKEEPKRSKRGRKGGAI